MKPVKHGRAGRRVEGDTEAEKKAMYEQLMEEVVRDENAVAALRAVMRNKGAPGIDHMTTEELEGHFKRHWGSIKSKLLAGTYAPTPVKRVEIPKPDGGMRTLGIPTVLDRCIQQMLLNVLTLIYDPMFSGSSYGFRPGRSAQDAVKEAQRYAKEGRRYVVDIDIAQFFDRVNHDILITRIGKTIRDKRVLRLIGRYLRTGALINGVSVSSEEGTPVWIFQANPNRYDILNSLGDREIGNSIHWLVKQHRGKIHKGHIALIWMSGRDAGIYALTRVESEPAVMNESDAERKYWLNDQDQSPQNRVRLTVLRRFVNKPIFKTELLQIPALSRLSILRQFQGANFPVRNSEWAEISSLFR